MSPYIQTKQNTNESKLFSLSKECNVYLQSLNSSIENLKNEEFNVIILTHLENDFL